METLHNKFKHIPNSSKKNYLTGSLESTILKPAAPCILYQPPAKEFLSDLSQV